MRTRRFLVTAAVSGCMLAAASPAAGVSYDWNFCSGTSLNVCMEFTLADMGSNNYQLTFKYASTNAPTGQQGLMTGAGLYTLPGATSLDIQNESLVGVDPNWAAWSIGTNGLSGGGNVLIEVAGMSVKGATNGLPVGGWVTIGFSSTNLATYDLTSLHARAHIQSFGADDCSLKPDSRLGVIDGATAVNERCGDDPITVSEVPEPLTMILVGSGLAGIGAARRRRRGADIETA